MKVAAIVQARLMSGRLGGKVLLPLPYGRTVLEEVLFRCQAIPGVDVVVAAIANNSHSDALLPFVAKARHYRSRWHYLWDDDFRSYPVAQTNFRSDGRSLRDIEIVPYQGPEHDVLKRHIEAAEYVRADVILRVTSDCPLISPQVCCEVLKAFQEEDVDYASNILPQTWPHGYDCEVFSLDLLRRADKSTPRDAEHVSTWMQTSPDVRRVNVSHDGDSLSHLRLTLDDMKDYTAIRHEMIRRLWAMQEDRKDFELLKRAA